jgi:hypothetical protein
MAPSAEPRDRQKRRVKCDLAPFGAIQPRSGDLERLARFVILSSFTVYADPAKYALSA